MTKFEYKIMSCEEAQLEEHLEISGSQGWELVAVKFYNQNGYGIYKLFFKKIL